MSPRTATVARQTRETDIELTLNLDGSGAVDVQTGLGFWDHMLTALAFHAGWDLRLTCGGDLAVDDHHSVEDCALALGQALREAVGDGAVLRYGEARVPMDEALAEVAVDWSGRPFAVVELGLVRETIGAVATENLEHALTSLALAGAFTLHVAVPRGGNDHHRAEAAFKAVGRSLRAALTPVSGAIRSTKGEVA
jgi:imidazoleglycerol phosphate dehydratase HisB